MDSKDGQIGVRLDAGLQERIGAYATRELAERGLFSPGALTGKLEG
jgi:hypothetical protein